MPKIADEGLTLDEKLYSWEEVEAIMRFALKTQFDTLESILQERGLITVDVSLMPRPDEMHLGEGWLRFAAQSTITMHYLMGLQVPLLWVHQEEDEARRLLREKMSALGDAIWALRQREKS